MAQAYVYAGVAGYFGRPNQAGLTGVFRRTADDPVWKHVLKDPETFTVCVHPRDANLVFAGTADGVWRSTEIVAPHSSAPTFSIEVCRSGPSCRTPLIRS
jgi:hypothetical protein